MPGPGPGRDPRFTARRSTSTSTRASPGRRASDRRKARNGSVVRLAPALRRTSITSRLAPVQGRQRPDRRQGTGRFRSGASSRRPALVSVAIAIDVQARGSRRARHRHHRAAQSRAHGQAMLDVLWWSRSPAPCPACRSPAHGRRGRREGGRPVIRSAVNEVWARSPPATFRWWRCKRVEPSPLGEGGCWFQNTERRGANDDRASTMSPSRCAISTRLLCHLPRHPWRHGHRPAAAAPEHGVTVVFREPAQQQGRA